ncbi:MAG TPA: class I SAM-dependent methyltransferase [Streptosporangiaceae bacterium]|jgi:SAM-dependent methyltransferase|nr:class I SAM-dependent methyltransferase [Streptosporangiaceae bacterium]
MQAMELRKLAELEERHWWYRERRAIVARELRRFPACGRVLDIGAAFGGNVLAMQAMGWNATAVDCSPTAAKVCRRRGISVVRADARDLPVEPGFIDFVVAFDLLDYIEEDHLVMQEIARVLRPGGGAALIAVSCDRALWFGRDETLGRVRRYSRASLLDIAEKAGLVVDRLWSWNVLPRPVVALRPRISRTPPGRGPNPPPRPLNAALSAIIAAERFLPVRSLPGASLIMRVHRE